MSVETTVALSRHPMIVGLKDATGDNARVAPMRAIIGDDFRLYSGAARGRMCTACARHVHWACALGVCALHVHWACVHCMCTMCVHGMCTMCVHGMCTVCVCTACALSVCALRVHCARTVATYYILPITHRRGRYGA